MYMDNTRSGFAGRVALVTGAASGIGRATSIAFAAAGIRAIVIADLNQAGMDETACLVRDQGSEALTVVADVANPDDVEQMVQQCIATFGRLDYAFNNAGIESTMTPTGEVTEPDWERTIGVNLTGTWLCMRAELPHILAAGSGAIVNCASVAGLVGFQGAAAYVASKHGVVGLTKSAALDYATTGLRVNAVCPGVIRTAMVERVINSSPDMEAALLAMEPVGRLGTPEEIAQTVIWLCSDAASFITGQAIAIDGGFVTR